MLQPGLKARATLPHNHEPCKGETIRHSCLGINVDFFIVCVILIIDIIR